MSKRKSNPREKFSTTVDKDLLDEMKKFSDETDIPISRLTDRAFRLFLEHEENKKREEN